MHGSKKEGQNKPCKLSRLSANQFETDTLFSQNHSLTHSAELFALRPHSAEPAARRGKKSATGRGPEVGYRGGEGMEAWVTKGWLFALHLHHHQPGFSHSSPKFPITLRFPLGFSPPTHSSTQPRGRGGFSAIHTGEGQHLNETAGSLVRIPARCGWRGVARHPR